MRLSAGMRSTNPRPMSRASLQYIGVIGEEPVQSVSGDTHGHGVEAPPALIAFKDVRPARVEPEACRIGNRFGQRGHIAQAHI